MHCPNTRSPAAMPLMRSAGVRRPAICLAMIALLLLCPLHAAAQSDRDETTPTGWWVIYDMATPQQVEDRINMGYRLVDLEVVQASPLLFHAVFVLNQGVYARNWWWYFGVMPEQLGVLLDEHNARLIDLEPYVVNGRLFFAAIMIHNVGSDASNWWWLFGQTFEELEAFVTTGPGEPPRRIIDLERYEIGGQFRYAAVMIQNTGAHAKPWWWFVNITTAGIAAELTSRGARLVDLEPFDSSGSRFMAVMVPHENKRWGWWWGAPDGDTIMGVVNQFGGRIIDLERYPTPSGPRYAAVFLNNSNALTKRIAGILEEGTDGDFGLYLKRVGGPVLAWLQADWVFEPASAIKVLHHAHALLQVQNNPAVNLNTPLTVFLDADGSCPILPGMNSVTESLSTVLQRMMVQSDNFRTQAVRAFFGEANINATAQNLGMTNTLLDHRIGCCREGPDWGLTEPNRFTLQDAGILYEGAATNLFTDAAVRQSFYDLMITTASPEIATIIAQEAAAAGLNAADTTAFTNAFAFASKGGSYGCSPGGTCCIYHRTRAGWVSIPFRSPDGCHIRPQEFVLGIFVNNASIQNDAATAMVTAYAEILRDLIRDAALTWTVPCPPCPNPACLADWNCDGRVNSLDISAFITSWLASVQNGTLEADFDGNGVVNSSDISAFITAWLAAVTGGC